MLVVDRSAEDATELRLLRVDVRPLDKDDDDDDDDTVVVVDSDDDDDDVGTVVVVVVVVLVDDDDDNGNDDVVVVAANDDDEDDDKKLRVLVVGAVEDVGTAAAEAVAEEGGLQVAQHVVFASGLAQSFFVHPAILSPYSQPATTQINN